MSTATAQIESMRAALESLESDMLAASSDPAQFAALDAKRRAMNAELIRLGMLERKEQAAAERQHKEALIERRAAAGKEAVELRQRGVALEERIRAAVVDLEALVYEGFALTAENRRLAGVHEAASATLHRTFRVTTKPEISRAWQCPAEQTTLAAWSMMVRWLHGIGLSMDSYSVMSATQTAFSQKKRAG